MTNRRNAQRCERKKYVWRAFPSQRSLNINFLFCFLSLRDSFEVRGILLDHEIKTALIAKWHLKARNDWLFAAHLHRRRWNWNLIALKTIICSSSPLPPHANQFLITSPERKVHDAGGRTDDQKGDQERRRRVHVQGVPGFDHRKQFRGENDPAQYQTWVFLLWILHLANCHSIDDFLLPHLPPTDKPYFIHRGTYGSRNVTYGYVGGMVNLTCEATAEPPANFTWSANNKKFSHKSHHIFTANHISMLQVSPLKWKKKRIILGGHVEGGRKVVGDACSWVSKLGKTTTMGAAEECGQRRRWVIEVHFQ